MKVNKGLGNSPYLTKSYNALWGLTVKGGRQKVHVKKGGEGVNNYLPLRHVFWMDCVSINDFC